MLCIAVPAVEDKLTRKWYGSAAIWIECGYTNTLLIKCGPIRKSKGYLKYKTPCSERRLNKTAKSKGDISVLAVSC